MTKPPANLEDLVQAVAVDIGATEAAAFRVDPDYFDGRRINLLVHLRPDKADEKTCRAAIAAFKEILAPCVHQAKDGAIEIDSLDKGHGKQFCLVTLASREVQVAGAAAYIVRCADVHGAKRLLLRIQRAAFNI